MSGISVRGTQTDVYDENTRTQVEASDSTLYPVIRVVPDGHSLKHGKSILRIDQGSSAGYHRIRNTGSSESEGVECKDATRRLTRAREPGHLMRLPHSHLTRQSREA